MSHEPAQPNAAVWSGRLAAELDPRARALNDSLPVDRRLWPEELALSRAYAAALVEAGILATSEAEALGAACDALERELESGTAVLEGEDIHSAVEADLTRRCGDPARRLHTGRSRNDQVSTLMRLRVMRLCDDAVEYVREVERVLVGQARAAGALAVAGSTHLQPAQPLLLAHVWLAHVAALERDEARFQNAREASDALPLGAGALAGTPLRYDRAALATRLGFSRLAENSLDAVGDRDFALEYLNAAAVLGVHLSRLAEDLVLWCSPGFGWYAPPDGFSTGSSLLPQKRNPDLFELARAKAARLIANVQRLAIVLKGLPSSYQKDLQEDKEAVFDTADTLSATLAALAPAIAALVARPDAMARSLGPELLAVELADSLVADGVPFREAHALVGRLWAAAERAGLEPARLPEAERIEIAPQFTDARLASLTVEAALARRSHAPGAGPGSVAEQLARAEERLGLAGRAGGTTLALGLAGRGRGSGLAAGSSRVSPRARTAVELDAVRGTSGGPQEGAGQDEARLGDLTLRRATLGDVPGIAHVMAEYVLSGDLLPRPVSELYQCVREFHVAERDGRVVGCAALRLLWEDLGEVRSLAVAPEAQGKGLGTVLLERVIQDARSVGLPRLIALTREVPFFERSGFAVVSRETLPRKVWTDCVRCPRRHACDEVAVVLDLVPGASEAAAAAGRSWVLPIPQLARSEGTLPIVSSR